MIYIGILLHGLCCVFGRMVKKVMPVMCLKDEGMPMA